jgi:hypothetical protein
MDSATTVAAEFKWKMCARLEQENYVGDIDPLVNFIDAWHRAFCGGKYDFLVEYPGYVF